MDKNTLIGLLLIVLLFVGFSVCSRPDRQAAEAAKTEQAAQNGDKADNQAAATAVADTNFVKTVTTAVRTLGNAAGSDYELTIGSSALTADSLGHIDGTVIAGGKALSAAALLDNADTTLTPEQRAAGLAVLRADIASANQYGSFAAYTGGADSTVTVRNKELELTFSSRGGRISRVVLPGYKTETTGTPTDICLFDAASSKFVLELETATQRISTAMLNFRISQPADSVVLMSLPLKGGAELALRYTIRPDFVVTMDILQKGMDKIVPTNRSSMRMRWSQQMHRNEKGRTFEERNSAIYYKFDGENPDDMSASSDDNEDLKGNLKWVGFKNQFFSSVVIAKNRFNAAQLDSKIVKSSNVLKDMSMDATFDYSSTSAAPASFAFYFGPNDYPLLSHLDDRLADFASPGEDDADLSLNKLVPLGWGIFGWINRFCVIPVFSFLSGFISNYGIIIIILTLLVKLVLLPLTFKSYKSQAKMRVLAPEINALNEKYPGQENAMKRQQETMKLYSRAGASPFSGCLPMLLQMPVLIAMFAFFPSAIELRGESFLWAHDLSAPDYIFTLPFSIPFLGNHLSLFCLLMTVVNIIYTYINMQLQPSTSSMPGMKWMMYLMPLMFLFFFNDYASGLSLYYFVFLLVTILQTYAFRLGIDEKKVRAEMEENAKKPRKKSGFMARLEAAQRQQEAMMREQNKKRRR